MNKVLQGISKVRILEILYYSRLTLPKKIRKVVPSNYCAFTNRKDIITSCYPAHRMCFVDPTIEMKYNKNRNYWYTAWLDQEYIVRFI